jgi:hypothetical protein
MIFPRGAQASRADATAEPSERSRGRARAGRPVDIDKKKAEQKLGL